jgi:hypothetical protein
LDRQYQENKGEELQSCVLVFILPPHVYEQQHTLLYQTSNKSLVMAVLDCYG